MPSDLYAYFPLANQRFAGLGTPQVAERIEKRMVAREEGNRIANTGTAVTQDWDSAWDSDGETQDEPENGRNRHSLEEERRNSQVTGKFKSPMPS